MNFEMIFALVMGVLFLGSIGWLIIYARLRDKKYQDKQVFKKREGSHVEVPKQKKGTPKLLTSK